MTTALVFGDCFKEIQKYEDKSIDYCFTSPPYNRKRNDKYDHYDDNIDDYYLFLCNITKLLQKKVKNNIYINIMKNYYNKSDVFRYIGEFNKDICDIIIWEKSNPLPASGYNITNAYEYIIVIGEKLKSNKTYTKNIITTSVAKMPDNHKAVMNQKVAEFIILNFTKENETIIDPFMGTGTTGIVCKNNNRNFIGIEISEQYFNMSKDKIENKFELF